MPVVAAHPADASDGVGYEEGVTHDWVRHGTTTVSAALDIANGTVFTQSKPRHRHQGFLTFLRYMDKNVREDLQLHIVLSNCANHEHPKVEAWLLNHPRYHLHFTPTYSSWLNQVERWFSLITQQGIRRGSFGGVKELVRKIDQLVTACNQDCKPFIRHATAESTFEKMNRSR